LCIHAHGEPSSLPPLSSLQVVGAFGVPFFVATD
jgi:hypothetical protein